MGVSILKSLLICLCCFIGVIENIKFVFRIVSFYIYFSWHCEASLVCACFMFNPTIKSGTAVGILHYFLSTMGFWVECSFANYFYFLIWIVFMLWHFREVVVCFNIDLFMATQYSVKRLNIISQAVFSFWKLSVAKALVFTC